MKRFQVSLDERPVHRYTAIDNAFLDLQGLTVGKYNTGYLDEINSRGEITRTLYRKESTGEIREVQHDQL